MEEEARRTFTRHLAGRRVVDVTEPGGRVLSAVGTGHLSDVEPAGRRACSPGARRARPVVELRVPFTRQPEQIDDVERGAEDADWQPVKDAARQIAFAEDRAVFDGYPAAGIAGHPAELAPTRRSPAGGAASYPDAIAQALSALRLAGVDGPYALALSADAYTAVSETSDHGYPIREHMPAGASTGRSSGRRRSRAGSCCPTRGGDFELHLGQDLSIGYLSHDAGTVDLYFQETLTFLAHTSEASVALSQV